MKKNIISLFIVAIITFSSIVPVFSAPETSPLPVLVVFHSSHCEGCIKAKKEILPKIETEFAGRIKIEYRDLDDIENYKYLLGLEEKYKVKMENYLPVMYFQGSFLENPDSFEDVSKMIAAHISDPLVQDTNLPEVNLEERIESFSPLVVLSAGLIDGVNPCAFTVIVFFISFLLLQGYRRKDIILVGLSFILAVFLTYLLLGIGIFGFLYRFSGFFIVARVFNITIGSFSIVLGFLALFDFFKFRKTGKTEGLVLQLPEPIKKQIHKVIGLHYRKTQKTEEGATAVKKHIFALILSALITGFLVSLLEAVCTGQTYLPTIAFVLKTAPVKLQAFGYLCLYNLMFIIPLLVIFILALLGVSSEQFSKFLRTHLGLIKILMVILFFGLGIFLLWRL